VLNEINHATAPGALRYHVMADGDGAKVKERLASAAEKLFVLVSAVIFVLGWWWCVCVGGVMQRAPPRTRNSSTSPWGWSRTHTGLPRRRQLNDGLADTPSDALDYSMRQEQDRLLAVAQRIAKCMAR
jgi:hypothetical protein